ncbi:MAG: TAXI family TRAP transporter solute-binding subunit [Streptosporangiales bacterium]|nr:TAXI family TRAP transporter solute-binding subunit [Streptosporangiales bacterium]
MKSGNRRHRLLTGGIVLLTTGALALSGCSTPQESEGKGGGGGQLTMATGSTGGTYFPLGGEIAQKWTSEIKGVNVSTQASGASVENLKLLDQGEVDLIMAINGLSSQASEGKGAEFEGKPVEDIVSLGNVYHEVYQMVASKKSGIKTFADLKGKRVDIGPPGSGTALAFVQIMEAYGMDPEKDVKQFQSDFDDAATKLKDGQVDAAFAALAMPAGSISEISTSTPVEVVSVSDDVLTKLQEDDPTYNQIDVPAGTYGDSTKSTTVTNWATLYGTSELDDDTACKLTQTMYEQAGEMEHEVSKELKVDTADEARGNIKMHPGSKKYLDTKSCD